MAHRRASDRIDLAQDTEAYAEDHCGERSRNQRGTGAEPTRAPALLAVDQSEREGQDEVEFEEVAADAADEGTAPTRKNNRGL